MSRLFSPLTLRGTTLRNRVWVSPMCQYSSEEGRPTDWHLVHLGSFARGGAGLVMMEATAVSPEGRISPADAGIWTDEQADDYRRITSFIHSQGAVAGIQLAHAGRKGSTTRPWDEGEFVPESAGGWRPLAPSPLPYRPDWPTPLEMSRADIADLVADFGAAARRALDAGFEVAEIHAAHGYLLHNFLSPLSNRRSDKYGGDLAGRCRALFQVVDAVRAVWPAERPLFVRVSATDWVPGGWEVDDTVDVCKQLANHGVDLIDVSSGGLSPEQSIPVGPGYQVPFAASVRAGSGLPVGAVGMITEAGQAEHILAEGQADAVFLARALLRNPSWPQRAAFELGDDNVNWPVQYQRARWRNRSHAGPR